MTSTSVEETEKSIPTLEGYDFFWAWIQAAWARGEADLTSGGSVELANERVKGWKPTSVQDYLAKL